MTVIRSASAPVFEQPGTVITGLAAPSRGSREISAWRLLLSPGAASPDHVLTHEEVFVALSGVATATLDGAEHRVAAGDALVVSPGVPFRIATAGAEPFEAVACMRCGGLARVGADAFPPPWTE